jgi:outer membrane receptor for ferrienterochelin and colicin
MKLKYLLAASIVSLAATTTIATPAFAQQITSTVQGTVLDDAGVPLGGATVVVTDTRTNSSRTTVTGTDGRFTAPNVTVGGPFTIAVNADGYEGQTVTDVFTTLQGATDITFDLTTGTGEIVVSGARANVVQLAVGPGTNFTREVLEGAPSFNRDIRDVIRIDPRVSLDRDDGGSGQDRISCLGGNDRGNAFTIDGISQGDIYGLNDTGFASRSSTPVPFDAVSQTQVQFAPFDVEYGAFTGCAINVVTRSGSNQFTGSAFFEYSDSGMRGDVVAGRPVAPIEPEKRWGAALGGPIIPDRLFFFAAYEHQEAGQSQDDGPAGGGFANELAGVPVAAFNEISSVLSSVYGVETGELVRNRDFSNDRYFGRLDWQINDDHRLEGTYQRLEEGSIRPDDFFTGAASPQVTGLNTFYTTGTVSDYYSGRLYSNWSDSFSTELRYSRSDVVDRQDPIGGGEAQSDNPIPRFIVGIDNPTGPDGTVLAGPGNSRSANALTTNVEQYRALARLESGNHTLKFGAELNRADLFNLFVQNATGTLVFRNVNDLRAGLLSPGLGNNQVQTTPVNVIGGQTEGAIINVTPTGDVNTAAAAFDRSIYSIFAQDDWRVTDQLSAVVGLRVDWYDGGRPTLNENFIARYGFSNGTGFSNLDPVILPRFALSYDMDDFGVFSGAQLRGGVGIFSGGDPLVWFGNAFQNNGRTFGEGTTQATGCPAGQNSVLDAAGNFTGIPACAIAAGQAQAARGLGDTQSIDPDIEIPTVLRLNAGFSSQLNFADSGFFSGWNVNLDYIYSKFSNPFTVVDLAQTVDTRLGANGFTVDGRPILRAIDPTVAGCNAVLVSADPAPVYSGVNAACFNTGRDDELALANSDGFRSHNASFILSKNFDGGLFTDGGSTFFSLGYAYTDSQDRRNLYNSTAGSNYDLTAAFDRNNPAASRGFYESRHNITLGTNFSNEFVDDYATSFGFTFIARSGRPYSLTFTGGSVFNDSASGNDNALLYIPTGVNDPNLSPMSNAGAVAGFVDFIGQLDCAQGFEGRTIDRNTCTNDWYYDLDLTFSQELPGPGRLFGVEDKLRLYATFDNFLNFLDQDWNVQNRRNFAGLQDVAGLSAAGVDSQGRYIINSFIGEESFDTDNGINVTSSVWRLKVGVSYEF